MYVSNNGQNRSTRTIPGSLGKRPTTAESPNPHYTRVVGETPNNGRIAQPTHNPYVGLCVSVLLLVRVGPDVGVGVRASRRARPDDSWPCVCLARRLTAMCVFWALGQCHLGFRVSVLLLVRVRPVARSSILFDLSCRGSYFTVARSIASEARVSLSGSVFWSCPVLQCVENTRPNFLPIWIFFSRAPQLP
jgi:hypothetical protein